LKETALAQAKRVQANVFRLLVQQAERLVTADPPPWLEAVEVLKALDTYHLSYLASIGYDKRARLPLIPCPALVTCNRSDMLWQYFEAIIGLVPGGRHAANPGTGSPEAAQGTARLLLDFFAEPQACGSGSATR
jgi:hypothetical protein